MAPIANGSHGKPRWTAEADGMTSSSIKSLTRGNNNKRSVYETQGNLNSVGNVITQSGVIEVASDHTNVYQPGFLGGVTVARARIFVKFVTTKSFDVDRPRAPFMATVELVDSATGKTALITTEWVFVAN